MSRECPSCGKNSLTTMGGGNGPHCRSCKKQFTFKEINERDEALAQEAARIDSILHPRDPYNRQTGKQMTL